MVHHKAAIRCWIASRDMTQTCPHILLSMSTMQIRLFNCSSSTTAVTSTSGPHLLERQHELHVCHWNISVALQGASTNLMSISRRPDDVCNIHRYKAPGIPDGLQRAPVAPLCENCGLVAGCRACWLCSQSRPSPTPPLATQHVSTAYEPTAGLPVAHGPCPAMFSGGHDGWQHCLEHRLRLLARAVLVHCCAQQPARSPWERHPAWWQGHPASVAQLQPCRQTPISIAALISCLCAQLYTPVCTQESQTGPQGQAWGLSRVTHHQNCTHMVISHCTLNAGIVARLHHRVCHDAHLYNTTTSS